MERLEPTALLGREAVLGEREARELEERLAHELEPLFQPRGEGAPARLALGIGSHRGAGVAEESGARRRVLGGAVGLDERERLARLERVELDRGDDRLLLLPGQSGERVGERGADRAVGELLLDPRREPRRERDPPRDPRGLPAEEARRRLLREAVLLHERHDDAPLVERAQRPGRGVREEEEALPLGRGPRGLDDGGHEGVPRGAPPREPLQAVDDLVGAVLDGHNAHGQIAGLARARRSRRARAEGGEARAQELDREKRDVPRGALGRRSRGGPRRGSHGG